MTSSVSARLETFAADPHNKSLKPLIQDLAKYINLSETERKPQAIEQAFEVFLVNKFKLTGHTGASKRYIERELPGLRKNISETIEKIYQANVNSTNPIQDLRTLFEKAESIGNWANTPAPAIAEVVRDTCIVQ